MKFFLALSSALLALTLGGCSTVTGAANEPVGPYQLTISEMPESAATWGTLCQSVLGSGWYCAVDLSLVNNSQTSWGGYLTAQLVADDGSVSDSSSSPDSPTLMGSFSQNVNPGEKWEWVAHFGVGEGKKFTKVLVLENGKAVASLPICIGSSDALSLGC